MGLKKHILPIKEKTHLKKLVAHIRLAFTREAFSFF